MGSWTADLRTGTFQASAEGARLLGWTPGPHAFEELTRLIHPEDLADQQAAWSHAATTGEPYEIEHRVVVGGQTRWLRARADFERDADGHVVRAVGITLDVTASRQAEDRVKRFVAGSPTVIYAWLVEPGGLRHSWTSGNLRQLTAYRAGGRRRALVHGLRPPRGPRSRGRGPPGAVRPRPPGAGAPLRRADGDTSGCATRSGCAATTRAARPRSSDRGPTSPRASSSRRSSARRRRWRPSAGWPAASPTTSTTC